VELIMPTIEEEKPAKPRPPSRKTADQRNPKGEQKVAAGPESDPVGSAMAPIEADPIEIASVETTPVAITAVPAITMEAARDAALSGEVLPPEVRQYAPQTAGAQAIALAYGDYTRKSLAASRFLVERLMTVRSIDEAIEIQGEFAKQAYANFLTHSQKICELYGEWAQQLFAPIEKFTTPWTRIGR
jgi:hypothetical protein